MTRPIEGTIPDPDLAVSADGAVSADELEADIELTREQLVDTVDALSEKLDVTAQARNTVRSLKPRTVAIAEAALAAALITVGAVVVWRKRR
jgi:nucleotide-binding universal stress UspA family protein